VQLSRGVRARSCVLSSASQKKRKKENKNDMHARLLTAIMFVITKIGTMSINRRLAR
jgi:hypothetical protein